MVSRSYLRRDRELLENMENRAFCVAAYRDEIVRLRE
jgi:hypothetical protein